MTITTEVFKRVSGLIKMSSEDQRLFGGGYGETCISYKMELPEGGLGIDFTHIELIDRYDCADGVMLGTKLFVKSQNEKMILAETDVQMEDSVITTFIDDEHHSVCDLQSQREIIIQKMDRKFGSIRAV